MMVAVTSAHGNSCCRLTIGFNKHIFVWVNYKTSLDDCNLYIWIPLFYCFVFRWVLCANHTEPVKGLLSRYLRRKLIETELEKNTRNNDLIKIIDWIPKIWHHLNSFLENHSSSDITIGKTFYS